VLSRRCARLTSQADVAGMRGLRSIAAVDARIREEPLSFAKWLLAASCIATAAASIAGARAERVTETIQAECPGDNLAALCHAKTWGDFREAQARLLDMASRGDYADLAVAITDAAERGEQVAGGDASSTAAYAALDFWARSSVYADGSIVRNWSRVSPKSPYVVILQAMELTHRASKFMGTRNRRSLPPEVQELISQRVRAARDLLSGVQGPARDSFAWRIAHLHLLAYEGSDDFSAQLSQASQRWPHSTFLYADAVGAKAEMEDWKGVNAVIDLAVQRTQEAAGLEYYARLYVTLGARNMSRPTELDWSRMRTGFEGWLGREPSWIVRNLYAAYACAAGDVASFRRAMGPVTGERIYPEVWLAGHPHEACVRWSSQSI
jgi:hypothetical protein